MNARLILPLVVLALAGCEAPKKRPEPFPPQDYSSVPRLFRNRSLPTDPRIAKYPQAEAIADRPGHVRSPYTGDVVDVKAVQPGGLARDPSVSTEARYFRVP